MKKASMNVIYPNAAGIDVGSRTNYVAIGQGSDQVRSFGVYTSDHQKTVEYLKTNGITHVAMESTGSYWQTIYKALIFAGFEVCLVNGNQTRNVHGKTDVKDCQWIQKLYSLGLLSGSFLPDVITSKLSTLYKHRESLVNGCADMTNKMQKSLRLMNIRLDIALTDINGKSGTRIIEAILEGQRDGLQLAALVDHRVKKSQAEIADALTGNRDEQLLYELRDSFDIYNFLRNKIVEVDSQLENTMNMHLKDMPKPQKAATKKQTKGKNQIRMDLPNMAYQYYGVDLFSIPGVSTNTVMCLISQVGFQFNKFATARNFTSWLRLAPQNKITGGKIKSSRTSPTNNRLTNALRNAANTIGNNKNSPLNSFFCRIAFKKGRAAAITATARKIATILWNMIVKQQEYNPINSEFQTQIIRQQKIRSINKMLSKFNIATSDLSIT